MAKGPFMEYLRASAIQTAANAYKETTIPTPTSKTENLAMLIHSIEMVPAALIDTTPTNADNVTVHVSKLTKTGARDISDPDILGYFRSYTALNAVFNQCLLTGSMTQKFDPPILYPHTNLYLGISTVGYTAITNVACRIGYTLEKVSREDFISALVE
ncbi:hypothetical protein ES703_112634 [subsurface metagenome]